MENKITEDKVFTQASETLWKTDEGVCKVRIEVTGQISETDIDAQCQYTIKGIGYGEIE